MPLACEVDEQVVDLLRGELEHDGGGGDVGEVLLEGLQQLAWREVELLGELSHAHGVLLRDGVSESESVPWLGSDFNGRTDRDAVGIELE